MSRLPVIDKSAWINPGNRPEKETAIRTRVGPSRVGSIGGKGIHTVPLGIDSLMTAPRPYKETPLRVPLAKAPVKVQPVAAAERTQCPHCPLSFQTSIEAHSHARLCARVQVVTVRGPGVEDLAKLWKSQQLVPDYAPVTAPRIQVKVLVRRSSRPPAPKVARKLPPPAKPATCAMCGTWFPSRAEREKHHDVCRRNHKRDYFYLRWCDDGGVPANDD